MQNFWEKWIIYVTCLEEKYESERFINIFNKAMRLSLFHKVNAPEV